MLSTGVESKADMWDGTGTKEQFLCHMMMMRENLGGMGLFLRHEEAEEKLRDENEKLQMEKETKQFADEALSTAVTAADKEKAKADVKKQPKNIKQFKDAIIRRPRKKNPPQRPRFFPLPATSSGETAKPCGTKLSPNKPSVTRGSISEESNTPGSGA
eukprot:scaffold63795_cov30-Cyclotella_meneghiniana.AAC.1